MRTKAELQEHESGWWWCIYTVCWVWGQGVETGRMLLRGGVRHAGEWDGAVCSVEAQEKAERLENGGYRYSSEGERVKQGNWY